jgi:hypothetical protein
VCASGARIKNKNKYPDFIPLQKRYFSMNNKNWVSSLIKKCEPIKAENIIESQLVDLLVKICYDNVNLSSKGIGVLLSAAYDLVISAE